MAQSTVLALGTTPATSSDVVVAAGEIVTLGIFTDNTSGIPKQAGVTLMVDTPGLDIPAYALTPDNPVQAVSGPCTIRAVRPTVPVSIGVFKET